MTGITAALWRLTKDDRFKSVYAGLFGAAVMAFPALLLRALGPNNDQLGSITQFLLCAIGAGLMIWLRKNKIEWDRGSLPFGLVVAGIGFAPFAIYGSFGSFGDAFPESACEPGIWFIRRHVDRIHNGQFISGWRGHRRGACVAWFCHWI